jgi:uncharacterized repeat protein (TIGR03803 family)
MNFKWFHTGSRRKLQNTHYTNALLSGIPQPVQRFRPAILAVVALALMAAGTTTAQAQFSVLYDFGTTGTAGANPSNPGILAQGRDGNMYGTTVNGGANAVGSIFQITPAGKLTEIYSFDQTHGYAPYSGLTLGTDGNFYGATQYGGTFGFGTIFQVTPSGAEKPIYNFTGGTDGLYPSAPPVLGTDGSLWGTSQGDFHNNGTLYQLTTAGKFTRWYTFIGPQGSDQPRAPLLLASDGNFYGTTQVGGRNGDNSGTLFSVTPAGKVKILFDFDGTHGAAPLAPLIQGSDGFLYGTTFTGGSQGAGVVFRAPFSGKPTVLYNLPGGIGPNNPYGGMVQATDGNFYGTTFQGGAASDGDIFRMTSKGLVTPLLDFNVTNGYRPEVTLLQHTNGILYGDTVEGGTGTPCQNVGCGVFFSWNPGLKPFVRFVSPTGFGKVGTATPVQILGQGFTGTTGVSFAGVAATFTVVSDTYLTAVLPTGAMTGSVTVTTPGGILSSNVVFRVLPAIRSFSPTSGKVGASVTITGQSLTQTTKVTFAGKAAKFTVNSDTQVTATVPTGAKTGTIGITTKGGTAISATSFTVLP